MGTGEGRVRFADVAPSRRCLAGTASKALNGRAGVGRGTATRVQEAAERLGYRPDALAAAC